MGKPNYQYKKKGKKEDKSTPSVKTYFTKYVKVILLAAELSFNGNSLILVKSSSEIKESKN